MRNLFVLVFSLLNLSVYTQQIVYYGIPESEIYSDVFFNRKALNPAVFDDTVLISGNIIMERVWVGMKNSPEGYSISLESNLKNSGSHIGLVAEFFDYGNDVDRNQSYELFYSYDIVRNSRFSLSAGAGMGFMQTVIKDLSENQTFAFNSFPVSIGGYATIKNHSLGLSYNDYLLDTEIKDENGDAIRDITGNFAAIYAYKIHLGRSLTMVPELLYFRRGSDNGLLLNSILDIKGIIQAGIFVDNHEKFGWMFSGTIARILKLGYASGITRTADDTYHGSHVLKLGLSIHNF